MADPTRAPAGGAPPQPGDAMLTTSTLGQSLLQHALALPANFDEPEVVWNRKSVIVGVTLTFLILKWITVVSRLYTRWRVTTDCLGWDDLFVGLVLVTGTSGSVFIILTAYAGLGQHAWLLPLDELTRYLKYFYAANGSYITSTGLVKLSLLFQYRRVFATERLLFRVDLGAWVLRHFGWQWEWQRRRLLRTMPNNLNNNPNNNNPQQRQQQQQQQQQQRGFRVDEARIRAACAGLIVFTALWASAYSVIAWVPCWPVWRFWAVEERRFCYGFSSVNPTAFFWTYVSHAAVNMVLDVLVLLIPVPLYWRYRGRPGKRVGLLALHTVGGVATFLSIWRLVTVVDHRAATYPTVDPTWYGPISVLLSTVEVGLGAACASVPVFWPVLARGLGRVFVLHEIRIEHEDRPSWPGRVHRQHNHPSNNGGGGPRTLCNAWASSTTTASSSGANTAATTTPKAGFGEEVEIGRLVPPPPQQQQQQGSKMWTKHATGPLELDLDDPQVLHMGEASCRVEISAEPSRAPARPKTKTERARSASFYDAYVLPGVRLFRKGGRGP